MHQEGLRHFLERRANDEDAEFPELPDDYEVSRKRVESWTFVVEDNWVRQNLKVSVTKIKSLIDTIDLFNLHVKDEKGPILCYAFEDIFIWEEDKPVWENVHVHVLLPSKRKSAWLHLAPFLKLLTTPQ